MRSVVFQYDTLSDLGKALDTSLGQELQAPPGVTLRDGEWVLVMFELRGTPRATAAAARAMLFDGTAQLLFERRDWERLRDFARPVESTVRMQTVRPSIAPTVSGGSLTSSGSISVEIVSEPDPIPEGMEALRRTQDYEHPVAPVAETPESVPDVATRPYVFLVDDDTELCEVVVAMLDAVGLDASYASSAEEGAPMLEANRPALLILDWSLPGLSGLEWCRGLRAAGDSLPILFLTAHAGTQDMVEAFAAGADDYVVKPFRAAELGARIFGLLRRARSFG